MIIVGYIIGFRFQAGVAQTLGCIALVSAFGLALSWIFAFVALTVRSAEAAQTAGFVILFPLVFASSVFVPVSTLPNWLQAVAKVSPVTLTANAACSLVDPSASYAGYLKGSACGHGTMCRAQAQHDAD